MMASLARMGSDVDGVNRGDIAARAMFGCYPGTMPTTGMVRTDRPMDPAKDVLVVFWAMNEIMVWDAVNGVNTAMPFRGFPAALDTAVKRMVRMM